MGIFDKLFGKKGNSETTQLIKTSEMLDEDFFWGIIDNSLVTTDNQDDQLQFLNKEIVKLTPSQIIGFKLRTDKLLHYSYSSKLWCAAYVIIGGCSDDGFEYFRCWLISKGKEVYYNALKNPDSLIDINDLNECEFELFMYVSVDAFKQKTGKELYDYVDEEKLNQSDFEYPEIDLDWDEDDPESMKKICPKLFEEFWED